MQDLKNIIESLLFVAEEPLPVEKLRAIIETADNKKIRTALQALAEDYGQRGGGFWLQEVAGGWQIRTRPEYHEWIKRMLQPAPQRLSKAALETLAVIAYKQPIIRADVEHIRGVDCGGVLRQLLERKLIRVLGRREIAGRPLIYATTKLFLEMFDLKDLNDLPTPKEIAELSTRLNSLPEPEAKTALQMPSASQAPDEPQASQMLPEAPPAAPLAPPHEIESEAPAGSPDEAGPADTTAHATEEAASEDNTSNELADVCGAHTPGATDAAPGDEEESCSADRGPKPDPPIKDAQNGKPKNA